MSELGPITAELRRVMNHTTMAGVPLVEIGEYEFAHRCDAIDAVHAQLERENAELRERVAVLDNERWNMHDGWIRLPLDADGVPIRVGDVMEWPTTHETFEVVGIGDGTLFYIDDGSEQADWTGASTKRHHHAPTVEDVLREFGDWYAHTKGGCDEDGIIAEYAKRLTLAEGEDA